MGALKLVLLDRNFAFNSEKLLICLVSCNPVPQQRKITVKTQHHKSAMKISRKLHGNLKIELTKNKENENHKLDHDALGYIISTSQVPNSETY